MSASAAAREAQPRPRQYEPPRHGTHESALDQVDYGECVPLDHAGQRAVELKEDSLRVGFPGNAQTECTPLSTDSSTTVAWRHTMSRAEAHSGKIAMKAPCGAGIPEKNLDFAT